MKLGVLVGRGGTGRLSVACALALVVGLATGCSSRQASTTETTATTRQALATSNGLGQNGLSTNGLWSNGLWSNGLWSNGLWSNGLWSNGLWSNGLWSNGLWSNGLWSNGLWSNGLAANGLWSNGLWSNGLWSNGLWSNGLWSNGLSTSGGGPLDGSPAATLQSSPYLRELLQYVYACAMPTPVCPAGGGQPVADYDTALDPNDPSDASFNCTPQAACPVCPASGTDGGDAGACQLAQGTCDTGYTCAPSDPNDPSKGRCVVQLKGAIGLAINDDGTHWWDPPATSGGASEGGTGDGGAASKAGTCDESCQRWISACVLARTNAYGVHVEISMRAPADAPPGIKKALATSSAEVNPCPAGDANDSTCGYTVREGAYYGNIFATTPATAAPSTTYSGPAGGPIAETPSFYACAGPGSNIPELTKRFCSSQGDQAVIDVPGVCLTRTDSTGATLETGVCAGEDADPANPANVAIRDCTGTSTMPGPDGIEQTSTVYKQVITVYLQQPIAVCGNAVCEETETPASCPSDCHPGTWAKFLAGDSTFDSRSSSAVDPSDGSTVVAGVENPSTAILVDGTVSPSITLAARTPVAGDGLDVVLIKYDKDGHNLWKFRFESAGWQPRSAAVAIDRNHNILLGGGAFQTSNQTPGLWFAKFNQDGSSASALPVTIGAGTGPFQAGVFFARADSNGDLIVAGNYVSQVTLGTVVLQGTPGPTQQLFVAKVCGTASCLGQVEWAQTVGTLQVVPQSLAIDGNNDVLLTTDSASGSIFKLSGQDGTASWPAPLVASGRALTAVASNPNDPDHYVYATYAHGGLDVVKYPADGSAAVWGKEVLAQCPTCGNNAVYGQALTFDEDGNLIVSGQFGNGPQLTIDFGAGVFNAYATSSIFVVAYRPDGTFFWAKDMPVIPSVGNTGNLLLAPGASGQFVLGAGFNGSIELDDRLLVNTIPEGNNTNTFIGSFAAPSSASTTPAIGAGSGPDGTSFITPTNPQGSTPSDIFIQATSSAGACVFYMPPTAIEVGSNGNNAPGTTVQCSPPPNTTFPISPRTTTNAIGYLPTVVTCKAADPFGNTASSQFNVYVVDSFGPVFAPSSVQDITVQGTGPSGTAVTFAPTAVDQVDSASTSCSSCLNPATSTAAPPLPPPATCAAPRGNAKVVCTQASGSMFQVGKNIVTCTATDAEGNSTSTSFTVNVTDPPPVLSVPANIGTTATGPTGAVVTYSASATDVADGTDPVTCSPPSGSTFALGATTVSCGATNMLGETTSASFTVTVVDSPPTLAVPAGITAEATGPIGAVVTYSASATDLADVTDPVTCSPSSGSTFPIATTTVTCSATNESGMTSTATFNVTVTDLTPPVLTVPSNVTATATGPSGAVVTFSATATDLVDGTDPVTCAPASGGTFGFGRTTVTCAATDRHGNSASASFTVTVSPGTAIVALDPTASGAIRLSGNASLAVKGNVFVDSSSADAVDLSGSTRLTSSSLFVAGGDHLSGTASVAGPVVTGIPRVPDPLAWLPVPSPTGLTVQAPSTLTIGGSQKAVLNPGIYEGAVQIAGNSVVSLNPGTYYLEGGLTLGNSASLSGKGVFLYNASSSSGISVSGSSSMTLTPATTGTYAGLTIFENRTSKGAVTIAASGAMSVHGTIYAAAAPVTLSGAVNSPTLATLVVADTIAMTGSGTAVVSP